MSAKYGTRSGLRHLPLKTITSPLTQSADGTVVSLVAQGVSARVAEAQVSARQDEGVAQVRQAHHALVAVVAVLVVGWLRAERAHLKRRARLFKTSSFRLAFRCAYLDFLVVLVLDAIDLL